jgi:hypothetical protein
VSHGRDDLKHGIDLREHVVVPEAQDAEVPVVKPPSARCVLVPGLRVLAAVQFDDEPSLRACEVGDEWPNGVLAAEAQSMDLPATQPAPEQTLGIGHGLAQLACSFDGAHSS